MPDAMKNIGSMAGKIGGGGGPGGGGTKWGAILPAALAGFGLYGNIKGSNQRNAELARLDAAQKKWTNMSPAQLAEMVAKTEAPLSADLTANVGNQVNAMMAERGLAQAPGIFASSLAQGLAPYEQANRDAAMKLVFQQMGLPMEYAQSILGGIAPGTDLSNPLAMIMRYLGGGGGGGVIPMSGNDPTTMPPDMSTGGLPSGPFPSWPPSTPPIFGGGGTDLGPGYNPGWASGG
jgi:hypothetical protein